jgi:hypothetical protein
VASLHAGKRAASFGSGMKGLGELKRYLWLLVLKGSDVTEDTKAWTSVKRFGRRFINSGLSKSPLLQVDGLIMPGLVELCAPHLVHALVVGAAESHGRPESDVEVADAFEGSDESFGVELRATTL